MILVSVFILGALQKEQRLVSPFKSSRCPEKKDWFFRKQPALNFETKNRRDTGYCSRLQYEGSSILIVDAWGPPRVTLLSFLSAGKHMSHANTRKTHVVVVDMVVKAALFPSEPRGARMGEEREDWRGARK